METPIQENINKSTQKRPVLVSITALILLFLSLFGCFNLFIVAMWGGLKYPIFLVAPLLGIISFFGLLKMKKWTLYTTTSVIISLLYFLFFFASKVNMVYEIEIILIIILVYLWSSYKKFN